MPAAFRGGNAIRAGSIQRFPQGGDEVSELFQSRPEIEPVWNRIPSFFAFPFQPSVLAVLGGFTVLYALAFLPIPLLSLVIWLLAWMGVYKYAYEVLANTATGDLGPPEGGYNTSTDYVAFKHVGLMLIMMIATFWVALSSGSAVMTWAVILFFVLAWPAAIITLAMTDSLIAALNPVTWVSVIGRIGWPYLAASVFLFLMEISEKIANSLVAGLTGGAGLIGVLIGFFVSAYFLVATFHLMGYLVYQHHEELGVEVDEPIERNDAMSEDESLVARSRELVQEGQIEEALGLIREHLRGKGGVPAVHDQYRKLLQLREDRDALLEHGREYVGLLLHGFQDERKALRVTDECLAMDPEFRPGDPDDIRVLVERADQFGMERVVLHLTNGFAKRYPNHRDIPAVHLLAARYLADKRGEDRMALDVLRDLQKRYPEHPLREEIDRQAEILERIVQAPGPGAGSPG